MSTLKVNNIIPFSTNEITMVSASLTGSITNAENAESASFATTSSYALRAEEGGFPFTGSAEISGSLTTDTFQVTNDAVMPVGTTAQRPSNPTKGSFRYNTSTDYFEVYTGNIWANINFENVMSAGQVVTNTEVFDGNISIPISATGGTVSNITADGVDYKVHTFTSSDTFSVTSGGQIDILAVGGGGGGAGYAGGGGGGEVAFINGHTISSGSYFITVGAGGAGNDNNGGDIKGSDGTVTTLFGETIKSGGGGRGSDNTATIGSNVSNGGGGGSRCAGHTGTIGSNINIQFTRYGGNTGGTGKNENDYPGGGGAGAGENGQTPSANTSPGGNGGDGVQVGTIYDGVNNYYWAGGGGATAYYNDVGGNGGLGGGGGATGEGGSGTGGGSALNDGGTVSRYDGGDGGANTGGGGGSGGGNNASGNMSGNGGSGIVIIRYQI